MAGLGAQRAVDREHIGPAEDVLQPDELDPQLRRDLFVGKRVMSDVFHVEGFGEAEQFGADIADADGAKRTPHQPDAHMLGTLVEPVGTFAGQAVLGHHLAGQREHEGHDGNRNRPAHAVRRDDQDDARLAAGLDIDIVVADAKARHHAEPAIGMNALPAEARTEKDQGVEIGELIGLDRIGRFEKLHLQPGGGAQRGEIEIRKRRRAIRFPEIARQCHAEGCGHGGPPISSCMPCAAG